MAVLDHHRLLGGCAVKRPAFFAALILTGATLGGMCWSLAGAGALDSTDGSESHPYQPKETPAGCGGMTYAEWLRFDPAVDPRPWWKRITFSLFGEIGMDKSALKISSEKATLSGRYLDTDKPSAAVQSMAIGLSGKVDL